LTFKPTYPHIMGAIPDWLVPAPTRKTLLRPKRCLLVHKDIFDKLAAHNGGFPDVQGAIFIQNFVSGARVEASLLGDPDKKRPDMERLTDVNEVWVACFRKPRDNQWRLMGRFAVTNVFIGLALHRRADLEGAYTERANEFAAEWDRLLPTCPVVRGTYVGQYMTKPAVDVDAPIF